MTYESESGIRKLPNHTTWADLLNRAVQRDVRALSVGELTRVSADYPHKRRPPTIVDGVEIKETLKERLKRETDELLAVASLIAEKLGRRAAQLEHLNRFPDEDPFKDGKVLKFEKSFPHSPDDKYPYVASKINGLWYTTGARSPQGVDWSAFVSWLGLGVDEMFCVKTGKKVIG